MKKRYWTQTNANHSNNQRMNNNQLTQAEIEFLLWCLGYSLGIRLKERQPIDPMFDTLRIKLLYMTAADEPNNDGKQTP